VPDDAIVTEALRIVSQRLIRGTALLNPQATRDYLKLRFDDLQHEVFCCLYLDNRHRVIAFEELFRGTIDGANVHPREVSSAFSRTTPAQSSLLTITRAASLSPRMQMS
jgi:DNA repair protein RadC